MPPASDAAPRSRALTAHVLAALGYSALSLVYLRPIARLFTTSLTPNPIDPILSLTLMKWVAHQARLGFPDLWNAPFFFPAARTLTLSDPFLGPGVFTAFVPNPVLAYNLLLFSSFVLCGWSTWWILRQAGTGALAAFFGGAVFAFSPFRWMQLDHLAVLFMQCIPLILWSFDRLLARPTAGWAAFFLAVYALHQTGGLYLGYMVHFPLLVLLLNRAAEVWQGRSRRTLTILLLTGVAAVAVFVALNAPYISGVHKRTLARSEEELRAYGASLVSFVTPAELNLYGGLWPAELRRHENSLWAGLLPTVLVAGAAVAGWRRRRQAPDLPLSRARRAVLGSLAFLGIAGFAVGEAATWAAPLSPLAQPETYQLAADLLAAGLTALLLRRLWGGNWGIDLGGIDPWERGLLISGVLCFFLSFLVVYLPLMALVPGLAGMRVPARFYAFVSLAVAWFAARALDRTMARRPARQQTFGIAAVALLAVELAPRPLVWGPVPQESEFPAVYHALAGRSDVRALLELPFRDDATENAYVYYGTLHWKPLVNGHSSFYPPRYISLRNACCHPVPDAFTLARLRSWGVSHVLVHLGALRPEERAAVLAWGRQEGIRLDDAHGPDVLFRIAP
jgi:hypothetical protein